MTNIDVDSHELAATSGGFYWPGPCQPWPLPFPYPGPFPGPIYDVSMVCWPIDPVY